MTAATTAPVRLDVWADVVCPWCFLGTVQLQGVLEDATADGVDVVVRHRPFQLNPQQPVEGVDVQEHLEAVMGREALEESRRRLEGLGSAVGISFDFAAQKRSPNTRDLHLLLSTYDGDARQRAVLLALYSAYFEQGLDLVERDVVLGVVSTATGESTDEVAARFAAPSTALDADLRLGRELGVTGVPTFVADAGTDLDPVAGLSAAAVATSGAQPTAALAELIAEARRRASA
jgi:predicted DsbA family dithiol-disulfide isomerase